MSKNKFKGTRKCLSCKGTGIKNYGPTYGRWPCPKCGGKGYLVNDKS